ncbi:MAG TPA: DUF5818 domain-containing protein [Bryobacteraceae bacterium]|nr:DUF5818 domain-containing protein [Bryobacteraceae bacterium]
MKKFVFLLAVATGLSLSAMAAEWTGYIADQACAGKQGAKAASASHAACAAKCIKGGSEAVLVTADGKVYKIADQAKVVDHAGQKVTLTGTMDGDSIKVDSVKM